MRKKENYDIYLDYIAENGQLTKHEKIATVKDRGRAEVTRNFYLKFYETLIQINKSRNIDTHIILM